MDEKLAKTMRIDIDPATLPPTRTKRPRRLAQADTFAVRRLERGKRNSPYDLLLESVYDGVLITDAHGIVLDFNTRAQEFFLMNEKQLLGLPVIDLVSGADESLIDTIQTRLKTHRYALIEARCKRFDGGSFPSEIAVNRLMLDGEGQLCFFVRDITIRKEAQEKLESVIERLQAHDRARMEFVSNVSHELRTPLTSMIYAVTNMLRGVVGPLPEKAVNYLSRLEADCKRLLATVNDILDLHQIENHTLTLTKNRIPIGQLVHVVAETLRVQADAKHQILELNFCPRECFVLCDGQKIERVMLNVLGNAIKFTPEGGRISVTLGPDTRKSDLLCITVSDNGVGIPKEALPKITQRYFRIGEQTAGTGLGLSISREIVELHGGSLSIVSPVPGTDSGTAVLIKLPTAEAPVIVIATDDKSLAHTLTQQLEAHGLHAVWTISETEAFALCQAQQADLLITDICSCNIPGADIFLKLRNDRRTSRLPAIALARDMPNRSCQEILQKMNVPVIAIPWRENDFISRVLSAFSGRSAITLPGTN